MNLLLDECLPRRLKNEIVLVAPDNRFETLLPLMPKVLSQLQTIRHGEVTIIGRDT